MLHTTKLFVDVKSTQSDDQNIDLVFNYQIFDLVLKCENIKRCRWCWFEPLIATINIDAFTKILGFEKF